MNLKWLLPTEQIKAAIDLKVANRDLSNQTFEFYTSIDKKYPIEYEKVFNTYRDDIIRFYKIEYLIIHVKDIFSYIFIVLSSILLINIPYTKYIIDRSDLLSIMPQATFFAIWIFISGYLYSKIINFYKVKHVVPLLVDNMVMSINLIYLIRGDVIRNAIEEDQVNSLATMQAYLKKTKENKAYYPSKKSRNKVDLNKLLLDNLEISAIYIEKYIPKKLRAKDVINDSWFKNIMMQSANSLRDKKKWILTPKNDTYIYLTAYMLSTLEYIIDGYWDNLEHLELGKEALQSSKREKIIYNNMVLIKTILLSLSPLIFFLLFQMTPYSLKGQINNFIIFGLLIWAGLTFLIKYDPDTSTKFLLLKDAKDLLSIK